jgi:hypothetical protein
MLNLGASPAYSVADFCGVQIGQVSENGTPLLTAASGGVILIPDVVEFQESDTVENGRTDVDFNGSGGYSSKRIIDDRITGQEAQIIFTGKQIPYLEYLLGYRGPVLDDNDNFVGTKSLPPSSSCRCDDPGAVGGIYMIAWANVFDCEGDPIFDLSNDRMYEITVWPWIKKMIPTTPRRRTTNAQDSRRTYRAQLRNNPNFGQGPGSAVLIPDQTAATPAQTDAGISVPMTFLSDVPFPGNCNCTGADEGDPWVDGAPIPVGEAGWSDPGGS